MRLSDGTIIRLVSCKFPIAKKYYLDDKSFSTLGMLLVSFIARQKLFCPDLMDDDTYALNIPHILRLYDDTWTNRVFWWLKKPVKTVWLDDPSYWDIIAKYRCAPNNSKEELKCTLQALAYVLERLLAPQQEQICETISI